MSNGSEATLLNVQQVARRYGVNKRTIWRWRAAGFLPQCLRITSSTVRWLAEDIERHIASLKPEPTARAPLGPDSKRSAF
jgi:predicted DNA-binding transcriptional regulator AlpA